VITKHAEESGNNCRRKFRRVLRQHDTQMARGGDR
jgi:hypothetical protein